MYTYTWKKGEVTGGGKHIHRIDGKPAFNSVIQSVHKKIIIIPIEILISDFDILFDNSIENERTTTTATTTMKAESTTKENIDVCAIE